MCWAQDRRVFVHLWQTEGKHTLQSRLFYLYLYFIFVGWFPVAAIVHKLWSSPVLAVSLSGNPTGERIQGQLSVRGSDKPITRGPKNTSLHEKSSLLVEVNHTCLFAERESVRE